MTTPQQRSNRALLRARQPYDIDCGARDPFGNHFRIVQPNA